MRGCGFARRTRRRAPVCGGPGVAVTGESDARVGADLCVGDTAGKRVHFFYEILSDRRASRRRTRAWVFCSSWSVSRRCGG
jgi:hypothetical protein